MAQQIAYFPLQLAVVLLTAPLINGIIKKIKAFTQKRKGPPLLQQYYDFYKLLHKTPVVSDTASQFFLLTPTIVFASSLAAAMFVPAINALAPTNFPADAIAMVSLLALGRFLMMAAALDPAGTFGGMGSSREAMISALIEPAILVSLFTVGLASGSTDIPTMFSTASQGKISLLTPFGFVTFLAIFAAFFAETARIPVDDPSTHLELTMVHEAMILEYSGRHLLMLEYGSAIKQLVLLMLMAGLFLPFGVQSAFIAALLFPLKIIILSVAVAFAEAATVKLKLFSVPNLAAISFILSILGFLQYFMSGGSHG
jgi:formate hydrogenlyase subunit 4